MKNKNLKKQGKLLFNGALFLVLTMGIVFPYPIETKKAEAASGQLVQTSQADFQGGTVESSLDTNQAPGDLRLKYKTESQEDTSESDFGLGNTKSDTSMSFVSPEDGGKVVVNQGYIYSSDTSPKLESNYVYNSFIDSAHNLLYLSTYRGGLAVVDTKGTNDPADDTLVTTYTDSSTPAIGSNFVYHAFLDSARNLLYVSTLSAWNGSAYVGGGLSVINTQGTVDPDDDTLVKTYTTGTTPAIATNYVLNSFLDSTHNLLYVSTQCVWSGDSCVGGGLSVINTQETVDPDDDTLVKTYTTGTTPAIGHNNVYHSFLDSTHNLLYVSTNGGGLSVINTQGTVDPADDTLVKRYTTATSPAIGSNSVFHSFLDSTHNFLYVSTSGGLSVINTQGTVDPADDTLVKTYNTSTTPAIGNNYIHFAFLDTNSNILHLDTEGGHSAISINNQYNPKGVYLKDSPVEGDVWEQKTSMAEKRIAAATGVIDGKIYAAGGKNYSDDHTASLEAYNPATDTWESKASMSTTRTTSATVVANGKLYVVGGINNDYDMIATLEVYDPASNTWETKTPMPTARVSAAAAVVGNKIYVVGGQNSNYTCLATLEVYDIETDTWETKAPMSQIRSQGETVQAIDGKLYVVGGGKMQGGYPPFLKSLEVYDPATDTWETKASMPQTRAGLTSVILNEKMLVMGGTDDDWYSVDDAFIYDPQANTWNRFTDLPVPLHRTSSQIVNGDLYIIGGKNSDYESTDDVYKLSSTYLSDAYQKETYSQINWDSTTPSGTSVELLYSLDSGKTYESLGTEEGTHYLPQNSSYSLRYKAVLTTNDTSITPSLNSVELKYAQASNNLYESNQGTLTSPVLDSGNTSEWGGLTEDADKPTGTSITYQTRVGDTPIPDDSWEDWKDATSSIASRDARYIQYKATLSTTDQNQTPVLHSLALNFSNSTYTPVLKIGKTILNLTPDDQISLKSKTLTFSGQVNNLSTATTLQIFQDGKLLKNVKISKNHRYRYKTKPRKNQTHTYQFRYLDKDNQVLLVSPEYQILIDKQNPKITGLPKTITASPGDTITWSTNENDQIDHYDITFRGDKTTSADPSFLIPENTPLENTHLIVRAYDKAGNRGTKKAKVRVR